jgi:hypothetical protein
VQSPLVEDDPVEILVGSKHVDELVQTSQAAEQKTVPFSTSGWATRVVGLLAALE